jgi:hypothetical protein
MKEFIEFCIHPIKKALWAPAVVFIFYVTVIMTSDTSAFLPDWWDSVVHFFGGVTICYLFWTASKAPHAEKFLGVHTRFSLFVLLVALTALAAVSWEIVEWVSAVLIRTGVQVTVTDTICDMFMGLVGGVVLATRAAIKHA